MSETREIRNRRIALELLAMLEGAVVDPTPAHRLADELEAFHSRWEGRGVPWLQTDNHYDPDEWFTAAEMSEYADVDAATVRRWNLRGHITASRGKGQIRYNVGEVVAYLAKRDGTRKARHEIQ